MPDNLENAKKWPNFGNWPKNGQKIFLMAKQSGASCSCSFIYIFVELILHFCHKSKYNCFPASLSVPPHPGEFVLNEETNKSKRNSDRQNYRPNNILLANDSFSGQ